MRYRIVSKDVNGEGLIRHKVQWKFLCFWCDHKRYVGGAPDSPTFATLWFDTFNEAKDVVEYLIYERSKKKPHVVKIVEFDENLNVVRTIL